MLLLANARLIDGTGSAPRRDQAVLIDGTRIVAVGAEAALNAPFDAERIDLQGKTLLPGFIDCHVHLTGNPDPKPPPRRLTNIPIRDAAYYKGRDLLFAVNAARLTLEAGFTTVQDLMAPNDVIFPLRDSVAAGEHSGPRILASGLCITLTGGHGTEYAGCAIVADGPDEILKAVRQQIAAGADVIKYMGGTRAAFSPPYRGRAGYTAEEMRPGVEEAHRAGLRVATHAHSSIEGIKNAIRAGVDSIEHGVPMDDEALGLMAEQGTYLCPTLSVYPTGVALIEQGLSPFGPQVETLMRWQLAEAPKVIARAKALGVKIALGTDAAMPLVWHGGNAYEFELLVDYGLTPSEAIVAGTRNAAENLGLLSELGTIEPGKLADVVIVDGDPLEEIRLLRNLDRITLVIKEGSVVVNRGLLLPVQTV